MQNHMYIEGFFSIYVIKEKCLENFEKKLFFAFVCSK